MQVLVTGATGFIGTHLVERLLESGIAVRAFVRDPSKAPSLRDRVAELAVGCLEDVGSLVAAADNVAVVYHLAGRISGMTRESFQDVNTAGTRAVLEAAAAQSRPPVVLLVSSLAAAGPSPPGRPRVESDPCQPISHYGQSKRDAESVAHQWAGSVPITIVRPPIVYGPGDRATLAIFRSLSWGVHLDPTRKGSRFSLVHVQDLVEGMIEAAARGQRISMSARDENWTGYYYISGEEAPTYLALGALVADAVGRRRWINLRPPPWLTTGIAGMQEELCRALGRSSMVTRDKVREATAGSWWCSAQRAREEIGFEPSRRLGDGLPATAKWYRTQGWI